ncbi:MAG: glycosyltransferase family 2 protein [Dehalococcoidia bacterium]|jgi:glycosyltransferase involved in cell wall biosynthesis
MGTHPPVSICLVTYNRAKLLPLTLDSILEQTFGDYELIISDDCSDDATEEICRTYAKRESRIRYLRNENNLGMPGNLNASLKTATGVYVAIMHDGDIYRSDCIAKWKGALDKYPSAGFVFNSYRTYIKNKEIIYKETHSPIISGLELGRRLLARWDSCVYGTVMVRKQVFDRLGYFDPQFGNFADVDMWLRVARKFDVAFINAPLITLMPRDPTRLYASVHWKVTFWVLGMHVANLRRYRQNLPDFVEEMAKRYYQRRRSYILHDIMICLKHRRWDCLREALAIWRDADDPLLRGLGTLLGRDKDKPNWYNCSYWEMASLKK